MKRYLLMTLVLSLSILTLGAVSVFADITVTVTVMEDDDSTPISGATVYYNYGGGQLLFGTTNASGVATKTDVPDGTTSMNVWVGYNNGRSATQNKDVTTDPNFRFNTVKVTLRMETSSGSPLDGGNPRYGSGSTFTTSWWPGGTTGSSASGETEGQLFPGTYSFEMQYQGTAEAKISENISGNTTLTWTTTTVTLQYSGSISYGGSSGDAAFFSKPSMELLACTRKFHARNGGRFDLDISGASLERTIVQLVLNDHNGNPLSGGTARGGYGSNYSSWHVSGSTDGNGQLFDIRPGLHATMSYEMKYNNTTENKTQDVAANSIITFQTVLLTLRLEQCDGTPLDGGKPRFGIGSTYTSWWFPDNNSSNQTGDDGAGELEGEVFSGTYSFEMQYESTAEVKSNVNVSGNMTLTWQTTNVTLTYADQISYGGAQGDSKFFTKPSTQLLPGTYVFHFRNGYRKALTFSGCTFSQTVYAPTIQIKNKNVAEDISHGEMRNIVELTNAALVDVKYKFTTTDGTARSGYGDGCDDYVAETEKQVTIPAGNTIRHAVYNINSDTNYEPDETVNVQMTEAYFDDGFDNPAVTITNASATGTINNDDSPPTISINDKSQLEDFVNELRFPVTISDPTAWDVYFTWKTVDGTAIGGSDFTAVASQTTMIKGEKCRTAGHAVVEMLDDDCVEPDETMSVVITGAYVDDGSNTALTITDDTGAGTIQNDDVWPNISFKFDPKWKSDCECGNVKVTLVMDRAYNCDAVTVDWATSNGTAVADSDYTASSGTATFNPGDTETFFFIPILEDTDLEGPENFFVDLSNVANAVIADNQGEVIIKDDDPTPTISIMDKSVDESISHGEMRHIVELTGRAPWDAYFVFSTTDGSAISTGDCPDYVPETSKKVMINANKRTVGHAVYNIINDESYEPDETVNVKMEMAWWDDGYDTPIVITDDEAVGTIVNDDAPPTIAIQDKSQLEDFPQELRFPVKLSAHSAWDVFFTWKTVDGTAIGGDDYTTVVSQTTMIKGEKCRVFGHAVVEMLDDVCLEKDETMQVVLTGAYVDDGQQTALQITDDTGDGLILNDDAAPVADFTADQTVGDYGSICVQFKNLSTNADEWLWDFGDGKFSTEKEPYHCFYNPPHKWYDIKLTAICEDHKDVMLKKRFITVHAAPSVAFNATPIAGLPGMEVQFTNNSGGSANHWWWDFGNGHAEVLSHSVMDMVNPVSTYMEEGTFSAGLYGYGNGGEDLFVVPNFIYVDSFFVELALESGSDTYDGAGWDNAIDHDVISSNATATGMNGDAWAVFSFADSTEKMLHKVRLTPHTICPVDFSNMKPTPGPADPSQGFLDLVDPTYRLVGSKTNLVKDFQIMVSTDSVNWEMAFEGTVDTKCDFVEFGFDAMAARYIKLVLVNAQGENSPYVSLAEFQAFAMEMTAPVANTAEAGSDMVSVANVPTEYGLSANYPNPFNPETTISFQLPEVADVMLHIYNVQGQKIATLVNERKDAGSYQVVWNGTNDVGQAVAGGMYIYKIIASNADSDVFTVSRKMTFLK